MSIYHTPRKIIPSNQALFGRATNEISQIHGIGMPRRNSDTDSHSSSDSKDRLVVEVEGKEYSVAGKKLKKVVSEDQKQSEQIEKVAGGEKPKLS